MANLPEIPAFDEGVYQIEQTDPVLGGAPNPATGAGLVNIPHQQLARRTRYLKQQLDAIENELAQYPLDGLAPRQSPAFSGNPTAPTPPQDTNNTRLATTAFVLGQAGSAAPLAAGTAAAGTSPRYARQDHRHPTDTTRAPVSSPAFTGTPTAPTASPDTNNNQIATTAFVLGQAGTQTPQAPGSASAGTSERYARQDHRHPTDTTRAPLDSPAFTGNPTAPTQPVNFISNRIATTSFVLNQASDSLPVANGEASAGSSPRYARSDHRHPTDTTRAPLASPAFTGNPTAPTQARGNNSDRLATTAFIRDEFEASLSGSGWQRLASGLIIQWGSGAYNANDGSTGTLISLPIAFPISFYQVVASDTASGVNTVAAAISGLGALRVWARTPGGVFANTQISWFAFGR